MIDKQNLHATAFIPELQGNQSDSLFLLQVCTHALLSIITTVR